MIVRARRILVAILALAPLAARADTVSSISANFQAGAVPAGDYLWFSAAMKPGGNFGSGATTVGMSNMTISFTANSTPYVVSVPSAAVFFNPALNPTTSGSAASGYSSGWQSTMPYGTAGNNFLAGVAFQVPAGGLPGGIQNVTWQATFTGPSQKSINWQWAAAVYDSHFLDNGYSGLGVKPTDDNKASVYLNSDASGTPEYEKAHFIGNGGTGGSGSNFTGSLSGTDTVNLTPAVVPLPTSFAAGLALLGCLSLRPLLRRSSRETM